MGIQAEVGRWLIACFGPERASDKIERNHRFFEEAVELIQSLGMSKEDCYKLIDYVYNRPLGNPEQEVGGVMTTLAALCHTNRLSMEDCGNNEMEQIWKKIEVIRHKANPISVEK